MVECYLCKLEVAGSRPVSGSSVGWCPHSLSFLSDAVPLSIEVDACGEGGSSPPVVLLHRRQTTSKNRGGVIDDQTRVYPQYHDMAGTA